MGYMNESFCLYIELINQFLWKGADCHIWEAGVLDHLIKWFKKLLSVLNDYLWFRSLIEIVLLLSTYLMC